MTTKKEIQELIGWITSEKAVKRQDKIITKEQKEKNHEDENKLEQMKQISFSQNLHKYLTRIQNKVNIKVNEDRKNKEEVNEEDKVKGMKRNCMKR